MSLSVLPPPQRHSISLSPRRALQRLSIISLGDFRVIDSPHRSPARPPTPAAILSDTNLFEDSFGSIEFFNNESEARRRQDQLDSRKPRDWLHPLHSRDHEDDSQDTETIHSDESIAPDSTSERTITPEPRSRKSSYAKKRGHSVRSRSMSAPINSARSCQIGPPMMGNLTYHHPPRKHSTSHKPKFDGERSVFDDDSENEVHSDWQDKRFQRRVSKKFGSFLGRLHHRKSDT